MAFLAKRAAIDAKLTEGWAMRTVYAGLEAELGISYQQFVRYVARYLPAVYADRAKPKRPIAAAPTSAETPDPGSPDGHRPTLAERPALPPTAPASSAHLPPQPATARTAPPPSTPTPDARPDQRPRAPEPGSNRPAGPGQPKFRHDGKPHSDDELF